MAAAMLMNSNSLPIALLQSMVITVPGLNWGPDDTEDAMVGRALTYLVLYSTFGMVVRVLRPFASGFPHALPAAAACSVLQSSCFRKASKNRDPDMDCYPRVWTHFRDLRHGAGIGSGFECFLAVTPSGSFRSLWQLA